MPAIDLTGMITAEQKAEQALKDSRAAALTRIDASFEAAAAALVAGYPTAERLTWPVQQAEALAWEADNATPTPYLDQLAVGRQVTPEEMRALTLGAVRTFLSASPALVGKRQRLRDEALEAKTIAALETINW